jgi:hypothetical protein
MNFGHHRDEGSRGICMYRRGQAEGAGHYVHNLGNRGPGM